MPTQAILVTDGHVRPSLAVVRSLGRAGYRVHVCSPRPDSLAGASRYAYDDTQVPPPLSDPAGFADAVVALARSRKASVIFPMSEEAMLALLPVTAGLSDLCVPFASLEAFRSASDKRPVMTIAAQQGIATPRQQVLEHRGKVAASMMSSLTFPLVIKPSRSVAGDGPNREKIGVTYATDVDDLERQLAQYSATAYPLLLQEKIVGPGTGVFLLAWNGSVIAQFAHRRIREKPPTGGVSVCAESIPVDPVTLAQSRALLAALDWRGPAMVEFKEDARTGTRYLMEINGRFWGSIQLAIDAGVDFPALLAAAAFGQPPAPVTTYRTGVRCHWWWGEVDHLIARMKSRDGIGSAARAISTFMSSGWGARNEVLRAGDPWPAVRETIDWFRGR